MFFQDQQLTRRALAGDHVAFGALYDRHSARIFALLRRLTGNATEAEDLTLEHANTWHLRGWKLLDGKSVPWEVWGRKSPFFYREQIGEETILDDGKQRVSVLNAAPEVGRRQGIVLRTPSQPNGDNVGWGFTAAFQTASPAAKVSQETAQEIVVETANAMGSDKRDVYTISKQTWRPLFYEVREHSEALVETVEHLDAEYDVPLAAALSRLDWPAGYLVVDAGSAPKSTDAVPDADVARSAGLTVQLSPLAMDSQGRILARVRGWLGSVPITGNAFSMNVAPRMGIRPEVALRAITDDQHRSYLFVPVEGFRLLPDMNPGTERLICFAPFKPLPKNAPLPRRLQVTMDVAPWTTRKQSGGGQSSGLEEVLLMSPDLTWNLPLPIRTTTLDPDAYLFPGWRERVRTTGVDVPTLDESVTQARTRMQQDLKKPQALP